MDQLRDYSDSRIGGYCIYCGGSTETNEHVPSRILLDKPYPTELPTILCCEECNKSFSLDEEYFACLIECAKSGGTELDLIGRAKVRAALRHSAGLKRRLDDSIEIRDGVKVFNYDVHRVKRILKKLALGHLLYEESEPIEGEPAIVACKTLPEMTESEREDFESLSPSNLFPEMGSRSMQRMLIVEKSCYNDWVEVQENRYRYLTARLPFRVRIVFSEYLAAEVIWEDPN